MYQHESKFLWSTVLGELPHFYVLYLQVLTMKIQERSPYGSDRMRRIIIAKYTENIFPNKCQPSKGKDSVRALPSWGKLDPSFNPASSTILV